jgi:tetratricopeptide (TPR) repeat protein
MNVGRTSRRPVRKSNPGTLQSDREVVEQFVVRRHELGVVLETLRDNIGSPSCQHVLVVAPRGRGKTMLLARVAAELRGDPGLSGKLLPVRFMEESHEISNIADFWLEALFHFAEECSSSYPELARELRGTHASLSGRWREQGMEELARAAVLSAADRLGRQLVLMVENLQSLCDEVDRDFGWKLRAVLQFQPEVMLLATATSRFDGVENADEPFFELFRTVDLKPLDTDECRRLWETVSGDEVRDREIRPLEILTGGSPRFLVIVAGFARHRSLKRLMEELVSLIDEHTEYFRGNLDSMPKTERRVYIAVIDLWRPSKTGEIAARARVDVRVASTMLGRLVTGGAVVFEGSGKKRLYRAAEGLYSLYYKIRRERDEAAVVEGLLRLMAVLYNESEREELWCELRREAVDSAAIRSGLDRFAAMHADGYGPIPPRIQSVAERHPTEKADPADSPPSQEVTNPLEPVTSINEQERHFLEEIGAAMGEQAYGRVIEIVEDSLDSRISATSRYGPWTVGWALLEQARAKKRLGDFPGAAATCEEVVRRFGESESASLQRHVARALLVRADAQKELGRFQAAVTTYGEVLDRFGDQKALDFELQVAWALYYKAGTQQTLGDPMEAIAAYDEIVRRFGSGDSPALHWWVAVALDCKGDVQRELGDYEAAVAAYDDVIARFGAQDSPELLVWVAEAWIERARTHVAASEFDAGIAACDEAIRRFGDSDSPEIRHEVASALHHKGSAQRELGSLDAALATWDEAIRRFGESDSAELRNDAIKAWLEKGRTRRERNDFEAAIRACDEVIRRFGASRGVEVQRQVASALHARATAQRELRDFREAIGSWDEVVKRFGNGTSPFPTDVASALDAKATLQRELGDLREAIATWDEVVNRFGRSGLNSTGWRVAFALDAKASAFRELGDLETAIGVYDDIVNRFGDTDSANLQWMVAGALIGEARSRVEQRDFEAGLAAYDQVTKRFGESDLPRLREQLASALIGKMFAQEEADEFRHSILTCEEVVERFGASGSPQLLRDVALALDGKGRAFRVLGDTQSAEEAYDELIARFGSSNSAELLRRAAEAWIHKGWMRDRFEDFERGVAVYQVAIERCDESGLSRLHRRLAAALINMADMQSACGRAEDALKTCEDVEKTLDSVAEEDRLVLTWRMDAFRARAWLAQAEPEAALRAFVSAYGSFVSDNPAILREMIDLVTESVAMGVPARELERTLSADEAKSEALSPLVAALRLEAGDEVRVPVEVREVAEDIRSRIEGFRGLHPGQGAHSPTAE